MPKVLSMPQVGLIIDALYKNTQKPKYEQKSLVVIGKNTGSSSKTVSTIRNILRDQKLLIIEGERKSQTTRWHPDKCAPNPMLLTEVYRIYTKNAKTRVKVKQTKSEKKPSLELAILTLEKLGFSGELVRELPPQGKLTIVQTIVLRKKA